MKDIIYFDNAATSWPKPDSVIIAMNEYNATVGASPGRSGHTQAIEAGTIVNDTRELLADLFNIPGLFQIAFTKNATESLNIALYGYLKPGDHVITTGMEHNSVMRPLRHLEEQGLELTVIPCSARGELDPATVNPAIKPNTKAIVMTHASNVTGTIMPLTEIGKISRDHGLSFIIDAAQSAGALPINVQDMNIDMLAFTGHKALYGPQGTGGLYIRKGLDEQISPLMRGGTGSKSEHEEQPEFMPDKFESGTPNTIGLAGLKAGVEFILETGLDTIRAREISHTKQFIDGIRQIQGVTLYGPDRPEDRTAVASFNIKGIDPSEAALAFDEDYNIMSRPGLHCAPAAHRTIGTFPVGTNRFSFGYFNTEEQIEEGINAIEKLAKK